MSLEKLGHLVTLLGVLGMHDSDVGVELRAYLAAELDIAVEDFELCSLCQQVASPGVLGVQRVQIADQRAFLAQRH